MNIDILKQSGINYEEGLERFSGNSLLYEKYLKKLLMDDSYKEMRKYAYSGEIEKAFEVAHNLKAYIGSLSINYLYEGISALADEFRAGIRRDYREDFFKLDQEYEKILLVIKEECDK